MSERARFKVWATAAMLVGFAAAAAVGCSAGNQPPGEAVGDGSGGSSGSGGKGGSAGTIGGSAGTVGGSAGTIVVPDGGPNDGGGGGPCVPATCTPVGGTYCGQIGDECGGSIECGLCMGDWTCEQHVCVGGPSCTPNVACTVGSAQFCGTIGDTCGHGVDCGTCPAGLECRNRLCVAPGCVPASSCGASDGVTVYCGAIGDGCGGTLMCDTCPAGYTCGGGGLPGICGAATCPTAVTCNNAMGEQQYCGRIGNGCGGVLDCPATCANGMACGMERPSICPGVGGTCTGIACDIPMCPNMGTTALTGTVFDPAGVNPIYSAVVYVPNAPLAPIPAGASCDRCGAQASGSPIAATL
ncbi:MAG TPA: hypothetical protein VMS65_03230, partial [Polyangiaceae bacterium]|nr:hypothetical protein [Polyangiaceae bacterium]